MKVFALVIIFLSSISYAEISVEARQLFRLYDPTGDVLLGQSGKITVDDGSFSQKVSILGEGQGRSIEFIPKAQGRTKFFINQDVQRKPISFYSYPDEAGLSFFTSFVPHSVDELTDLNGKVLRPKVAFGTYTLICESKKTGSHVDQLCIVANKENCNNFYSGLPTSVQESIATCNKMFFRMFSNAQISRAEGFAGQERLAPPASTYLSPATDHVRTVYGEETSFRIMRQGDMDSLGKGNVMNFLSNFHKACQSYTSLNQYKASTSQGGSTQGAK